VLCFVYLRGIIVLMVYTSCRDAKSGLIGNSFLFSLILVLFIVIMHTGYQGRGSMDGALWYCRNSLYLLTLVGFRLCLIIVTCNMLLYGWRGPLRALFYISPRDANLSDLSLYIDMLVLIMTSFIFAVRCLLSFLNCISSCYSHFCLSVQVVYAGLM